MEQCEFTAVRRSGSIKKLPLPDKQDTHLEKGTNSKHWADVEVEEVKEEIVKIEKSDRKFKCDECSYSTNQNGHLNRHKITRHKSEEDIVWYKCPKCPMKLKIRGQLRKHLQRAHDEVKEWFTCVHCPFRTKSKSYLSSHQILRHAPSESIKWFHCTQCDDYKARTKDLLQGHVKRKHDQFFFTCDQCPYKSKRKDALKKHEITKHEECFKWMKCDECGEKFKDEARLRSHNKRIHQTGEFNEKMGIATVLKEYSCSVCEFKTINRVKFAKHRHNIQPKIEILETFDD